MNLETKRLVLRNLQESDLDDFHHYRSNAKICKFQSCDVFTIKESKKFINEQSQTIFGTAGEWKQVGIELKENKKLIGDLALKPDKSEPRTVEIGVTLAPEYQKKGFAAEAFTKVFEHLFNETKTHRITAILDVDNISSLRLLENLNFRREAEFKKSYWDKNMNEWRDEYFYALLKEEWKIKYDKNF